MAVIRYTFTGALELLGALHIGSGGGGLAGQDQSLTDATVVRDSRGTPYIPGSSLRGVLRSTVAQIAPTLFGQDARLADDERTMQRLKGQADQAVQNQRERDEECVRQEFLAARLSPLERLFGTTLWASPLHIPDLRLRDGAELAGEIRHGVGIDRDTGSAREAIKYDFEVLPRGARFTFWMRCDIPDGPPDRPDRYRTLWPQFLALGLRLLEQGELTLGGRAARGVGQVQLTGLQVYRLDMGDRAAVLKSLLATSETDRYGVPVGNWMQQQLTEIQRHV
jgi:CRISPR-associated RAMP protein (TIGR02581 family)